jgi:GTPase
MALGACRQGNRTAVVLTFAVSTITLASGRATILRHGASRGVCRFLFLSIVP